MANTTFIDTTATTDGTPIVSAWLNDVNDVAYDILGNGTIVPATKAAARTNLGLDTMATQSAGSVAITGGSITGITDLAVADGGTGASTAAAARTNLGVSQTGPSFSAYRATSDQSVADNTFVEVVFNTELWDTDNAHNTTTGRFTPQVAGKYQINACVTIAVTGGVCSFYTLAIYKNGTIYKKGPIVAPATSSGVSYNVSGLVDLNGTTDYVSIFVFSDLSAGTQVAVLGAEKTFFDGFFVRT